MDEILLAVVAGMVGNLLDGHTGCGEHMLGPVNAAQYNIGLRMLPELLGDLAASTSEPGLFL